MIQRFALMLVAGVVVLASACSHFTPRQENYRESRSLGYLKPPEGVAIPRPDYTYRVPEPVVAGEREKPTQAEPAPTPPASPAATKPPRKTAVRSSLHEKRASDEIPDVPVFVERQTLTTKMPRVAAATAAKRQPQKATRAVTTRNWFVVDAAPEKVWTWLVAYWMDRKIPLVESNPVTGRVVTDWVPAIDATARKQGIRDRFEVQLTRDPAGSRITLKHRASRKTPVKGDKPAWAIIGVDPVLQGVETARLRDYLTGKSANR